jgi:tetratricopeptide (TPR) repeat protein
MVTISILTVIVSLSAADDPPAKPGDQIGPATEGEIKVNEAREKAIPVFNQGVEALEAKDMQTALEHFLMATEIDPDFPEAQIATAAVAMELKDFQVAANAAEEILRLQPDNVDAVGTAYFAELMIGDIDRLIPSAKRLADTNPEIVSNEMLQHAQVLFDDNELVGSRLLLEVILERQPELAPAYFQLGLTCNMQGDAECAKRALAKFIELAPDDPDAATAQSLLDYL